VPASERNRQPKINVFVLSAILIHEKTVRKKRMPAKPSISGDRASIIASEIMNDANDYRSRDPVKAGTGSGM
jgi:hypothetical protein